MPKVPDMPQIMQVFTPPRLLRNSTIKVTWTPSEIILDKITNKLGILEIKHSMHARAVTLEDDQDEMFTDVVRLQNTGYAYEKIAKAIS
jgi:hypothetical protein